MKNLIVTIVLIVVVIAALGLYRGWFHLGSDNTGGKPSVTLTVDKSKIEDDKNKAVEKVQDLAHQSKAAAETQKAKD